jgi:hypothetical protein
MITNSNFEIRVTQSGQWMARRLEDGVFIGPVDLPGHLERLLNLSDASTEQRKNFREAVSRISARSRVKPCDAQRRQERARKDAEEAVRLLNAWGSAVPQ